MRQNTSSNASADSDNTPSTIVLRDAAGATAVGALVAAAVQASSLTITGDTLILATLKTPASAAAAGVAGQIAWDTGFLYICTATNSWERVAVASW